MQGLIIANSTEESRWVAVHTHKGYDIKTLQGAGAAEEQGYKVDSWVVWAQTYPTIAEAVAVIDQIASN